MAGVVASLRILQAGNSSVDRVTGGGPDLSASERASDRTGSTSFFRSQFRGHRSTRCFQLAQSVAGYYLASKLRRDRRWWAIHRSTEEKRGFWESKVPMWHKKANMFPAGEADDFLDSKYCKTYRVDRRTFQYLVRETRQHLQGQPTCMRSPISPEKKLAMALHWMAHGKTFDQLGEIYHVGASTAHAIVHQVVKVLKENIVKSAIKFPGGRELDTVIDGFEQVAGLPMCAGAIDGTFVHMLKPSIWGDTYWWL